MANENPSRESQSRQQSAERSQSGSSQQGTGAPQGASQGSGYGQGASGQATTGQGISGQGNYRQGGVAQQRRGQRSAERGTYGSGIGTSTSQEGRQAGDALQARGGSSMSPYSGTSSGFGSGPFSVMRRISDEMDRLFENFGMGRSSFPGESSEGGWRDVGGYAEGATSMWSPHIEVCERNGKLLIEADLPGMKRDDVHVRVEDDEVIIQGERHQQQSDNQSGYYRSERSYGSFYRTIPLPEGTNADSANATFRDGVLEIELDAPRQQQRGRTLEIRDSTSSQSGSRSGTGSGATYGSGTTGAASSGTGASQQAQSGTGGSQQSSGSGTMYSGSGNPSVGAAGTVSGTGAADDRPKGGSNT